MNQMHPKIHFSVGYFVSYGTFPHGPHFLVSRSSAGFGLKKYILDIKKKFPLENSLKVGLDNNPKKALIFLQHQ